MATEPATRARRESGRGRHLFRAQPEVPTEPGRPSRDEASAQVLDDDGTRLDPGDAQGAFEIVDESLPEGGVLLGPRDERVEVGTCPWQLLRCLDPAGRSRREEAKQLAQALFVVRRHSIHHVYTTWEGGIIFRHRSTSVRRRPRQREMRLAIVPAGMSSASPIV